MHMSVTPITEDDIAKLTKVFYARVRQDEILGPIFNGRIGTDEDKWAAHIAHINDFWSGIFLKSGRFKGNPMTKHGEINEILPEHFTRWLSLFADTGEKVLPPQKMAHFNATANRIAQSLQMGLAFKFAHMDDTTNPFEKFGLQRPSRQ